MSKSLMNAKTRTTARKMSIQSTQTAQDIVSAMMQAFKEIDTIQDPDVADLRVKKLEVDIAKHINVAMGIGFQMGINYEKYKQQYGDERG